jgi:hypothetical protein
MWKEAAEPGVITTAAPGTDLSPDELNQVCFLEQRFLNPD